MISPQLVHAAMLNAPHDGLLYRQARAAVQAVSTTSWRLVVADMPGKELHFCGAIGDLIEFCDKTGRYVVAYDTHTMTAWCRTFVKEF